ncbi:hypothetical protein RCCS2_16651 [Roseobacter sp. CCS2]|nr:hypothetical protein RCCS2_16651 [Roseobacter sp. CCS2]
MDHNTRSNAPRAIFGDVILETKYHILPACCRNAGGRFGFASMRHTLERMTI